MIGTIAGYQLERELGRGGMGRVYIAVHPTLHHRIALKVLLPEFSQDQQTVARFFNEARVASALNHPNVVRVHDVGYSEDGSAYLVMELLDGESLADRLRARRVLTETEALVIARQVAGALAAAHAAGVIHRDVKPDNIFLVRDPDVRGGERAKLLDFGIAKLTRDQGLVHTVTGAVMGTAYYMSPEQCRGSQAVDARSDVYAVGCVLFEAVCGRPPFLGEGIGEILAAHQTLPPPTSRSLTRTISDATDRLIGECLEKLPQQRVQTMELLVQRCDDALRALTEAPVPRLAHSTTLGAAASQMSMSGPAAPRRRVAPIVVATVIGAGIAATATVLALRRDHGTDDKVAQPHARDAAPAPEAPPGWAVVKPTKLRLGLREELYRPDELKSAKGFRASRNVTAPSAPFLIAVHEVTWGELRKWSAAATGRAIESAPPSGGAAPRDKSRLAIPPSSEADDLPAMGVGWETARAYCAAQGGDLPSEEQWETAARGASGRGNPWGDGVVDLAQTRAYVGERGAAALVGTSAQDRTDGTPPIVDLAGNAQEWTRDLWRDDEPNRDESWVQRNGVSFRAVRGLPLFDAPPSTIPREAAAYRDSLCATGPCPADTAQLMRGVGFRCVRATP